MSTPKYLFEGLKSQAQDLEIYKSEVAIPAYISDNLKYELFEWQRNALTNFFYFQKIKEREENIEPTHLLFNMATGTGKTLLMAAVILYYYKQGHRNFIFFVNQNNIVGKTEDNLTDASHTKYLFKQNIVIDDRTVHIRKVNTFADESEDIQIKFTSIQQLHNDVYKVKEDNVFLEDLQKRDIIMLGDEAHHLNADTKKKTSQLDIIAYKELAENASQADIEKSWEHTVIELLLKRGKKSTKEINKNALLEFTATVPEQKEVQEKYYPKTICKFDLKDFLKAGFTKEINLVSSSFNQKKRILQALLFNWYRHKIALKHNIANFKPVILFRSKTIAESAQDFDDFLELVENITETDFSFLNEINVAELQNITETYKKGQSRILDVKHYLEENNISTQEIINYIKANFSKRYCIITNSKTNKTQKEKTDEEAERLLNSLEDKENHIRAIFTVKRLTEGWDVLNLFDIVRLYEGRDEGASSSGTRKAGTATVSEVQLIGRGVRYFPFSFEDKQSNKRKFDNDLQHELRVLEEFYFHSDSEKNYIDELKRELRQQGYIDDGKTLKKFQLKLSFMNDDFYKEVKLFCNEQEPNPARKKKNLDEIKQDFNFEFKIDGLVLSETKLHLEDGEADEIRLKTNSGDFRTLNLKLTDFEKHIALKAINVEAKKDNSVFRFSRLKEELNISSLDEIFEDRFIGVLRIKIFIPNTKQAAKNTDLENLVSIPNEIQLSLLIRFFEKLALELMQISNPYIGTEFTAKSLATYFAEPKLKSIAQEPENEYLENELKGKNWYVLDGFHGTSEERNLIEFLKESMGNFEKQYEKVFLIRNEEVYKIFDFEKGRGFQPDFLLMLKQKKKNLYYQVFIEPKGSQFKDASDGFADSKEGWKETFLEQISQRYGVGKQLIKAENKDYKLIGLPLYNQKSVKPFTEKVKKYLEVEL